MELKILGQDRFLRKDPNQTDRTKGATYAAANPAPKRGDDKLRKIGRPKGSEEDDGAPNVLTGTVITSCFIQTSALPSRIELEGNDLTFFDDTFSENGRVIGDTSRLIFTHGSGKRGEIISQGFIMEKRASVFNTYDNVLSWFAVPAKSGAHNYMFIGRNAYGNDNQRNLSSLHFAIDHDAEFDPLPGNVPLNGIWEVEYSEEGEFVGRILYVGNSEAMLPGSGLAGFSALMIGGNGGVVGLGYGAGQNIAVTLYLLNGTEVMLGGHFLPDADNTYDIGSPSARIRQIYVGTFSPSSVTTGAVTATSVSSSGPVSGTTITGSGVGTFSSISIGGGRTWTVGSGSPEGVVTAPIGSLYSNTAGGASTTLYVKTSGAGNTGWTAK